MNINELNTQQIQIVLLQRALENRAEAIKKTHEALASMHEKQNRGFLELSRQTLALALKP